jgi:hypothetical protein
MFIARIGIDRGEMVPAEHRYKNIGDVFWDENKQRASLKLTGLPVHHARTPSGKGAAGMFLAKVEGEGPLIEGDLQIWTGEYEDHGSLRKTWQWIGYIKTSQEHSANTLYWGQILVVPVLSRDKAFVYAHVFEEGGAA